ncbi:hypothetical protein Tco_0360225 [Tanacetum coccineum]
MGKSGQAQDYPKHLSEDGNVLSTSDGGHQVHRICVDGGSSFEILYEHYFNRLRPEIKNQMVPATTSLIGFSGENYNGHRGQITTIGIKSGDDEINVCMDGFHGGKIDVSTQRNHWKARIAEHRLNVRKGCQPVRQKKRGQAAERNVAINDEVSKLVTAGIMREERIKKDKKKQKQSKKTDKKRKRQDKSEE